MYIHYIYIYYSTGTVLNLLCTLYMYVLVPRESNPTIGSQKNGLERGSHVSLLVLVRAWGKRGHSRLLLRYKLLFYLGQIAYLIAMILIFWVKEKAAEQNFICSTSITYQSKALGERFRSPYRAFSAELIQHQFRQITFSQLLRSPG
eukprot:COSAG02_NODE_33_length_50286_cov_83.550760_18_plen_147_part_00